MDNIESFGKKLSDFPKLTQNEIDNAEYILSMDWSTPVTIEEALDTDNQDWKHRQGIYIYMMKDSKGNWEHYYYGQGSKKDGMRPRTYSFKNMIRRLENYPNEPYSEKHSWVWINELNLTERDVLKNCYVSYLELPEEIITDSESTLIAAYKIKHGKFPPLNNRY